MRGRTPAGRNNLLDICSEIADCGIDLGECDLHISSLEHLSSLGRSSRTRGHRDKKAALGKAAMQLWNHSKRAYEPVPEKTTPMVRMMIFRSSQMLQFSM